MESPKLPIYFDICYAQIDMNEIENITKICFKRNRKSYCNITKKENQKIHLPNINGSIINWGWRRRSSITRLVRLHSRSNKTTMKDAIQ